MTGLGSIDPFILLIVATVLVLAIFILSLVQVIRRRPTIGPITVILLILGLIFMVYLVLYGREIKPADWPQILLMIGLVTITAVYAWSTQKMAEEMRGQRIMASRPFIIQRAELKKAIAKTIIIDYFSHFEIYNAGNGPAIEVETSILNEEKSLIYSDRQSYLRTGESIKLLPVEYGKAQSLPDIESPAKPVPVHLVVREKLTYLVSEYPNIFSSRQNPTWYQTWLPFEGRRASKKGEIYVKPGELEFKEVTEKDRIDAFGSRSKPK